MEAQYGTVSSVGGARRMIGGKGDSWIGAGWGEFGQSGVEGVRLRSK
jgi:hypothetical protein